MYFYWYCIKLIGGQIKIFVMLKHLYQAQVLSFHLFMSIFVRLLFVIGEFMKLYYDAIVPEYYLQETGALFTTKS